MKLTKERVEARLSMHKADALFGGQVSAWVEGAPIPRKYKSRLEQIFRGWKMDDADEMPAEESTPIGGDIERITNKPKSKRKKRS